MGFILSFIIFVISVGIYFLPTLYAGKKTGWILVFIVNLLTGWTIIGWIVALIIAAGLTEYVCPYCKGNLEKGVKKCKHCGEFLN